MAVRRDQRAAAAERVSFVTPMCGQYVSVSCTNVDALNMPEYMFVARLS